MTNENQPTPEQAERLLRAIFAKSSEDPDDNYPDTIKEYISPAILGAP